MIVETRCLHCTLGDAVDKWRDDYKNSTGEQATACMIAQAMGAVLEDFLTDINDQHGDEGVRTVTSAFKQGQIDQRERIEMADYEPVEPDPNTKH